MPKKEPAHFKSVLLGVKCYVYYILLVLHVCVSLALDYKVLAGKNSSYS